MKWSDAITRPAREPNRGTNSIVEERKGFTIRTRGDTSGTIEHEYECPVHGRFKAMVPRSGVPDGLHCSVTRESETWERPCGRYLVCWLESPWCAPLVGIGVAAGEVKG